MRTKLALYCVAASALIAGAVFALVHGLSGCGGPALVAGILGATATLEQTRRAAELGIRLVLARVALGGSALLLFFAWMAVADRLVGARPEPWLYVVTLLCGAVLLALGSHLVAWRFRLYTTTERRKWGAVEQEIRADGQRHG